MEMRTGTTADAPAIVALLDRTMAWLTAQGRTGQWGDQPWSARPELVERIDRYLGTMHARVAVGEGGELLGVCVLNEEGPDYARPAPGPELYLRFLATERSASGSGVGAALVADAVAETRRRGLPVLRVDCFGGDDRRLVGQYLKLGFTPCGTFGVERADGSTWPGQFLEIRL
ncbi:GNAT family N-acetyltransferase [Kitasatospora sp. NPDC096147]|uniref:GNAT family N-acetyltransferase n=1 Tax=Kitasatospora sp. NPDC096147 TaxID=3364093 RepID=UPI0037F7B398